MKRALLDFEKLSINNSTSQGMYLSVSCAYEQFCCVDRIINTATILKMLSFSFVIIFLMDKDEINKQSVVTFTMMILSKYGMHALSKYGMHTSSHEGKQPSHF